MYLRDNYAFLSEYTIDANYCLKMCFFQEISNHFNLLSGVFM